MNNELASRYLWMSMQSRLNNIDYHIDGSKPFGYIFGVPCYNAQDWYRFEAHIKPEAIEKIMQKLSEVLRGVVT